MESTYKLANQRTLTISELKQVPSQGRAVMLPAFSVNERAASFKAAASLVADGCPEICCVGPEAELLHDDIDGIAELGNNLDLVTTWHPDIVDAVEYFIHGAGAQQHSLLALVLQHPPLVKELEREARVSFGG